MLRSQKKKRNEKCPCGSGKKLKHCCLEKLQRVEAAVEAGKTREQIINEETFRGNHL
jgi:hypothetical protein